MIATDKVHEVDEVGWFQPRRRPGECEYRQFDVPEL